MELRVYPFSLGKKGKGGSGPGSEILTAGNSISHCVYFFYGVNIHNEPEFSLDIEFCRNFPV
jgi:hypothetical protein